MTDRDKRFQADDASWFTFLPPDPVETDALTEDEAKRYLALVDWCRETFGNDPRIFLDDGYSPRNRWFRVETAYKLWTEAHPDDEIALPGNVPLDLGDPRFMFE